MKSANAVSSERIQMPVNALIIDDSPTARQNIKYYLIGMGCVVSGEAEHAADGLRLFRELMPDIVTVDLIMPKLQGLDPLEAVRTMKQEAPGLVIIVMSAVPFPQTVNSFLREGVLHYIVKPVTQSSFGPAARKLERRFPDELHYNPTNQR
jgi:two-component system, chemotaxis family, chemotaxis protein CheY